MTFKKRLISKSSMNKCKNTDLLKTSSSQKNADIFYTLDTNNKFVIFSTLQGQKLHFEFNKGP